MYRNPVLTTDGIVLIDERLVLIKRGHEPGKGSWALPGGIVEYGETTERCVERELEEETGLRTKVLDLVGVYSNQARTHVDTSYQCYIISRRSTVSLKGATMLIRRTCSRYSAGPRVQPCSR